jgi:hypothetical protein
MDAVNATGCAARPRFAPFNDRPHDERNKQRASHWPSGCTSDDQQAESKQHESGSSADEGDKGRQLSSARRRKG